MRGAAILLFLFKFLICLCKDSFVAPEGIQKKVK